MWDSWNKGVCEHGDFKGQANPHQQRQWKDIKHKYITADEDADDE